MKEKIKTELERDQDTGYMIYLTTEYRFWVNGEIFESFLIAKEYCRAMALSY